MTWGRPVLSREEAQSALIRAYCSLLGPAVAAEVSPGSLERMARAAYVTVALMAEVVPSGPMLTCLGDAVGAAIVEDFAMAIGGGA